MQFAPVATTKLRVMVSAGTHPYTEIAEVEAWGYLGQPPPVPRANVARASAGAGVTASSIHPWFNFQPGGAIDGDRAGQNFGNGGVWADATSAAWPDWLQVTFSGVKTIDAVDVFSIQDDNENPIEPTPTLTFNQLGLRAFEVHTGRARRGRRFPGRRSSTTVWSGGSLRSVRLRRR